MTSNRCTLHSFIVKSVLSIRLIFKSMIIIDNEFKYNEFLVDFYHNHPKNLKNNKFIYLYKK